LDKMKGVASNVKGVGENRVFAIGISFFLSKDQKPAPEPPRRAVLDSMPILGGSPWNSNQPYGKGIDTGGSSTGTWTDVTWNSVCNDVSSSHSSESIDDIKLTGVTNGMKKRCSHDSGKISASSLCRGSGAGVIYGKPQLFSPVHTPVNWQSPDEDELARNISKMDIQIPDLSMGSVGEAADKRNVQQVKTKKVEVGAGGKINQAVWDDPNDLSFWRDDPEGIICINYCLEVEARKIIEQGEINLEGNEEGFLQGIPVGN